MRKDFLPISRVRTALGYRTQDIVTNGTMITDAHLDRLGGPPSLLHISIDGPREVHDELRGEGITTRVVQRARRSASSAAFRWG